MIKLTYWVLIKIKLALSAILEPVEVSLALAAELWGQMTGMDSVFASARHCCIAGSLPASDIYGFQQRGGQDGGDIGLMVLVPWPPRTGAPGIRDASWPPEKENRCILSGSSCPFWSSGSFRQGPLSTYSHSKPGFAGLQSLCLALFPILCLKTLFPACFSGSLIFIFSYWSWREFFKTYFWSF